MFASDTTRAPDVGAAGSSAGRVGVTIACLWLGIGRRWLWLAMTSGLVLSLSIFTVLLHVGLEGVSWFVPAVVGNFLVRVLELIHFLIGVADHDVLDLLDDDEVGVLCLSACSVGRGSFSFGLAFSTASFSVQLFCCCFSSGSLFFCNASLFGS